MKYLIPVFILFLVACGTGEESTLDAKKNLLKEQEARLVALKDSIATLKEEIAAIDTNMRSNAIAVRAEAISKGTFKNPFQIQGLVESDQNVMITPEVPGKIVKIYVSEGQRVSKGQTIASLDGSVAQSQIAELENALTLAKTNYEKQKSLWEKNIGSEMQYLQAKNNYENLQNSIKTARTQLGKYTLISPINGTVDEIMANEGELVGSMTGGPVARIVNLSDIKIKASVSESYVGQMKKGDQVKVYFPSLDLELTEKIDAVGNVIDVNNRTFSVYVKPTSHLDKMKPNLLAIITAYDFAEDNVIAVPTKLINTDAKGDYILTLKSQGEKRIVQKSYIEIQEEFASETIIKSGLNPEDIIITEGYNAVIEGDEVKIIE
ncbi:efflux RND transporter periplasmic adaptor subunit [bacterium]|nr:efflux RND transporter periplasmic adaptor subunit [bacterium]